MVRVYIKVLVSERLPTEYKRYETNVGSIHFLAFFKFKVTWWLEELELPTEDLITKESLKYYGNSPGGRSLSIFKHGANFILGKLKGDQNE